MSNLAHYVSLWYHNSKMISKRDDNKDWMAIFAQAKELREQVKQGESYATAELKDIHKRASKAKPST